VGRCFDVIAGVQLWERMTVDGLHTDLVHEGAASDCRCFWLDLNHDEGVFLLIIGFVADLLLLRKVADWRCVIRASRAVCASVTAGLDLGWLGVRAAIFVGLLILCWHVPRL